MYIYIFSGKILIFLHNFMSFFPFRLPGVQQALAWRCSRPGTKMKELWEKKVFRHKNHSWMEHVRTTSCNPCYIAWIATCNSHGAKIFAKACKGTVALLTFEIHQFGSSKHQEKDMESKNAGWSLEPQKKYQATSNINQMTKYSKLSCLSENRIPSKIWGFIIPYEIILNGHICAVEVSALFKPNFIRGEPFQ